MIKKQHRARQRFSIARTGSDKTTANKMRTLPTISDAIPTVAVGARVQTAAKAMRKVENVPHRRGTETALCITAKRSPKCPKWVNRVDFDPSGPAANSGHRSGHGTQSFAFMIGVEQTDILYTFVGLPAAELRP